MQALWALPTERTALGPVATLPQQKVLVLPREKPLPEAAPETRWEKFAREKGIDKEKKRSRMVWDDIEQKWAPRFGFKRAYDESAHPIMEVGALVLTHSCFTSLLYHHPSFRLFALSRLHTRLTNARSCVPQVKAGDDPNADPWEARAIEKKARVAKNALSRLSNEQRAGKAPKLLPSKATAKSAGKEERRLGVMKAGIPVDLPSGAAALRDPALDGAAGAKPKAAQRGKEGTARALTLVQHSTASMGKFDVRRVGEPGMKRAGGERTKKESNDTTPKGLAAEKERNAKLLGRVLAVAERPVKPNFRGKVGERIEARKRAREFHPLDDSPYENLGGGESGEYKKKKGRAAAGKIKKVTKKRAK